MISGRAKIKYIVVAFAVLAVGLYFFIVKDKDSEEFITGENISRLSPAG